MQNKFTPRWGGVAVILLALSVCSPSQGLARSRHRDAARPDLAAVNVANEAPFLLAALPQFPEARFSMDERPLLITTEMRMRRETRPITPIVRMSDELEPNAQRTVRAAIAPERTVYERITRWNSVVVMRKIVGRLMTRAGRPAIIIKGTPRTALTMVATAYTGSSAGYNGGGQTATGAAARYGVVAVDPRLIPLGSRLFIPGYGHAVAADTGGAILGHRVDLCMNSLGAALNFGRQVIKVYVLRR
ncbi:MAG: 3D domain-containing protein [Candidatus Eremiobacteraeota bacterium]|nr:3D domain-containing protein [Candidatus Eremiobacteraeota bacterium]